ncbi:DUF6630 family protein [Chryseobacterium lathyri]|uniref:DUF6630 domain-containing protein n=1 Tax=Chryseobacterium lathyri TaxID=395933 RepID=A0ABT9SJ28_9FLAO|nr:DUF6630 family protein [Chryseobacterium lathyri]MDP9959437.1 hypothetical protein [Chryseobacterium lathyri]
MEKYVEIIKLLVSNEDDRNSIIDRLIEIKSNSSLYEDTFFRMPDDGQDIIWLAMVDMLIESGHAFEIDWKEDYSTAKNQTEILLGNKNASVEIEKDEDLYNLEAESFFPLLNKKIEKSGYQLLNLDIDSDSYVSLLVNYECIHRLLALDNRIKEYR